MLIDPVQIHAVSGEYRWPARMVLGRDHQEWRPHLSRGKLMPGIRWGTNGIRLAATMAVKAIRHDD